MTRNKLAGKPKVVVVGGGTAGLAAAYTLLKRKDELEVIVLEAGDYAGGRMAGDEVDGFYIDTAATLFIESYGTVRRLAEELGVPLKRIAHTKAGLVYRNGKFYPVYVGGSLKQRLRTARTFFSFRLLSPGGVWQLLRFVKMLKARSKDLDLENHSRMLDLDTAESFADFMESNSMGDYLHQAAQVDISCYTAGYPEQLGAAYAMAMLWNFSLSPSEHISVPEKGVGSFSTVLAQACAENTRLSTPVERVVLEEGVVKGVVTRGGAFIEADAVICATTATIALKIIPDLPAAIRGPLSRVSYSACCNVVIGLDSALLPEDLYAAAFPRDSGSLLTVVSDLKFVAPKAVPEGKSMLHVLVIADQARTLFPLSDTEIVDRVIKEICKYFPAMPEKPRFARVYRWPEAVCLAHGGMLKEIYEMRQQSTSGATGLFLAGDYMQLPLSNGAMRSGVDAAETCASFVSHRGP